MSYEKNIYYNPEACGLEIVVSEDAADSYEFDIFLVVRHLETGRLFWAQDSGCSCPTPFEGHDFSSVDRHTLRELTPETKSEFLAELDKWGEYRSAGADRTAIRTKALEALEAAV